MKALIEKFIEEESGATAIEYGLIAALVGVAIIAGVRALGQQLTQTFSEVTSTLDATDPG
ncbi:MAG: Flp family type IVb pilin [Pseudomonadota bacterium]